MYTITLPAATADRIFDALILGYNAISHDRTAKELGWLDEVGETVDLLQALRNAPRPPADFDGATPLEVLALSVPPISGGAPEPFEPTEADWADCLATPYPGWTDEDQIIAHGCC